MVKLRFAGPRRYRREIGVGGLFVSLLKLCDPPALVQRVRIQSLGCDVSPDATAKRRLQQTPESAPAFPAVNIFRGHPEKGAAASSTREVRHSAIVLLC
jgi:hypothetical protein